MCEPSVTRFSNPWLLLDLYEKLNQYRHTTTPSVSGSWLTLISGALHMIPTRRSSEFSDSITQQLTSRINFSLTISCGAANSPIPEGSRTFQDPLARHVRSLKSAFINLSSAIVDFRSKIKHATLSVDAIFLQAQELNTQLLRAEKNIPDSWRRTVTIHWHLTTTTTSILITTRLKFSMLSRSCTWRWTPSYETWVRVAWLQERLPSSRMTFAHLSRSSFSKKRTPKMLCPYATPKTAMLWSFDPPLCRCTNHYRYPHAIMDSAMPSVHD